MSKRSPSILWVLGWRFALVSVIFVAAIIMLLQSRLQIMADSLVHQALRDEARSIAARITLEPDGKIGFLRPGALEAEPRSILRYRIIDAKGSILFLSANWLGKLPPKAGIDADVSGDSIAGQINYFSAGPPAMRNHLIGATLATRVGDQRVFVQVFENLDQRGVVFDQLVQGFFFQVSWVLVPFVLLLLLVNVVSIWAGLRPLARVSRMAAEIGPETTGQRLPEEGQPREVLPLIRSVNRALERLDQGFQMQRQFTADAAHELRTPLAVLSAHLESLSDSPAVTTLRQEVATMSRLVGQLLRIAQLDALMLATSDRVDLHATAVEAAAALAPLALKAGKSIEMTGAEGPVWVRGDSEALGQAIRNLIENALRHTPKGTAVEIELGADRSLRVSDKGPGVAPENRELIFRRFWRASRRAGGAGLGLAIVAKVAETHGGSIRVEDAPGGGACFVLSLPAPPEPGTAAEGDLVAKAEKEKRLPAIRRVAGIPRPN